VAGRPQRAHIEQRRAYVKIRSHETLLDHDELRQICILHYRITQEHACEITFVIDEPHPGIALNETYRDVEIGSECDRLRQHVFFRNLCSQGRACPMMVARSSYCGFHPRMCGRARNLQRVAANAVGRPVEVHAYADRIVIRQDGHAASQLHA
jgi:hypothetical protein